MKTLQLNPAHLGDLGMHIIKGMQERPRRERMGLLFGRFTETQIEVYTVVPYRGGLRGLDFVEYDEELLIRRIRRLVYQQGIPFLGLYHSHPLRYDESIPNDLLRIARASTVDKNSFLQAQEKLRNFYNLDLIIAAGPARQAPREFRMPRHECLINIIRHRRKLWTICILKDRDLVLWMPGRVRLLRETDCCRLSGQFSWYFALRGYARDKEESTRLRLRVRNDAIYRRFLHHPKRESYE